MKKQTNDETFIIPLAIDERLSYDDINIDIVRLNAIDFKNHGQRFAGFVKALEKQKVPKDNLISCKKFIVSTNISLQQG